MSVNHRTQVGYGFVITHEEIEGWFERVRPGKPEWRFSDYGDHEALELLLKPYPELTTLFGGGGWSNSREQYAVVARATVYNLQDHDGIVLADNLATVEFMDGARLHKARAWSGASDSMHVLIAGGFY